MDSASAPGFQTCINPKTTLVKMSAIRHPGERYPLKRDFACIRKAGSANQFRERLQNSDREEADDVKPTRQPERTQRAPGSGSWRRRCRQSMLIRALDAERNRITPAQAQSSQAFLCSAIFHRIQKRRQNARTTCADGMSERNRSTIDVDAVPIPAALLAIGNRLR